MENWDFKFRFRSFVRSASLLQAQSLHLPLLPAHKMLNSRLVSKRMHGVTKMHPSRWGDCFFCETKLQLQALNYVLWSKALRRNAWPFEVNCGRQKEILRYQSIKEAKSLLVLDFIIEKECLSLSIRSSCRKRYPMYGTVFCASWEQYRHKKRFSA